MSDEEMDTQDDVATFKSTDDVTSFRTLHSKVEEILFNADPGLGDVYLVSRDRHYFLAHRIVLVSIQGCSQTTPRNIPVFLNLLCSRNTNLVKKFGVTPKR